MIQAQTKELGKRHSAFTDAIEKRLSIEDIRTEFVNLEKLKDINDQLVDLKDIKQKLENISESMLDSQEIEDSVKQILTPIKEELLDIKNELNKKKEVDKSTNVLGTFFGSRK
jgi:DNA-binding transcriptional regulator GbsR (MarR family)